MAFALGTIDVAAIRAAFRADGHVVIRDFLAPEGAEELRRHLIARRDWAVVLNTESGVREIPAAVYDALDDAQRETLDRMVAARARTGFQYRYGALRVPDDDDARRASGDALSAFARFMSSPTVVDLLRDVTGHDDIAFADAQGTRYAPGDFLTRHDDAVEGKHRRAAYVFSLSPGWQPEWGGLLLFHDAAGDVTRGVTPDMGSLRLFSVPADHSVSHVAPIAPDARLSVTGWLRAHPN